MRVSTWARTMVSMEAPNRDNADLPAMAAIWIIAMIVFASIALYLLLSAR
jgi:hypothetical protein